MGTMSTTVKWGVFETREPELAGRVKMLFEAHQHHVIATITRDGSPRVGGTNVFFAGDDMWIGMMPQAARVDDLRRDPRCAIHSAPLDEKLQYGDARLSLISHEASESRTAELLGIEHPANGVVFLLDITEVSIVRVEEETLVLESWSPDTGYSVRRIHS